MPQTYITFGEVPVFLSRGHLPTSVEVCLFLTKCSLPTSEEVTFLLTSCHLPTSEEVSIFLTRCCPRLVSQVRVKAARKGIGVGLILQCRNLTTHLKKKKINKYVCMYK